MPRKIWMQLPGLAQPTNMPVEQVNWRVKVRRLRDCKFDDGLKHKFLMSLQKHGKVSLACEAAGVLYATYRDARQKDEDFDQACEHTVNVFASARVHQLEVAAMTGHTEPIFGANGEFGERTRYESGLRAMVLKAYAPELYNEKQDVNVNHTFGAVVVPTIMNPTDWEAQFVEQQQNFEAITTSGEEADRLDRLSLPAGNADVIDVSAEELIPPP